MAKDPQTPVIEDTPQELFAVYSTYNNLVRAWFVTASVAIPGAFLVNDKLAESLHASGTANWVIGPLLIACAIQVVVALINKFSAWYGYNSGRKRALKNKWIYRQWEKVSDAFWFDIVTDIASVGFFGTSIFYLYRVFVNTPTVVNVVGPVN